MWWRHCESRRPHGRGCRRCCPCRKRCPGGRNRAPKAGRETGGREEPCGREACEVWDRTASSSVRTRRRSSLRSARQRRRDSQARNCAARLPGTPRASSGNPHRRRIGRRCPPMQSRAEHAVRQHARQLCDSDALSVRDSQSRNSPAIKTAFAEKFSKNEAFIAMPRGDEPPTRFRRAVALSLSYEGAARIVVRRARRRPCAPRLAAA